MTSTMSHPTRRNVLLASAAAGAIALLPSALRAATEDDQSIRPFRVTDSPAGLAAWLLGHPGFAQWKYGDDPEQSPTKDDVLDDITLHWLTNSGASSARFYWENAGRGVTSSAAQKTAEVSLPVAITVFPDEIYRTPETWARRAYRNLVYFHEAEKGGHFAAWEQPELFASELRAAFRPLRGS